MNKTVIIDACRTPIGKWGGSLKMENAVELGTHCLKELFKRVSKVITPAVIKKSVNELDKRKPYLAKGTIAKMEEKPKFNKANKSDRSVFGLGKELRAYENKNIDINNPAYLVEEGIIGNVLSSGLGQNLARQILIHGGCSRRVPASTINQVCGSGMKAIINATHAIALNEHEVMIAGGSESMSKAPYLLPNRELSHGLGELSLVDSVQHDGLSDAFHGYAMGVTAENLAQGFNISRKEQDEFAYYSQMKASSAEEQGMFNDERITYPLKPSKKLSNNLFAHDEYIRYGITVKKLSTLRPAFVKNGTVTAGNSSGINDGAAMLYLMGERHAQNLNINPLATIEATATVALDERIMGYSPVIAIREVLVKTGLTLKDIACLEINEAFAAQSLAVLKGLGLTRKDYLFGKNGKKNSVLVNPHGGAIALGHPIGCSGSRIVVSLIHILNQLKKQQSTRKKLYGIASLCIGGGQGCAVVLSV